jgi:hypothetical protein
VAVRWRFQAVVRHDTLRKGDFYQYFANASGIYEELWGLEGLEEASNSRSLLSRAF